MVNVLFSPNEKARVSGFKQSATYGSGFIKLNMAFIVNTALNTSRTCASNMESINNGKLLQLYECTELGINRNSLMFTAAAARPASHCCNRIYSLLTLTMHPTFKRSASNKFFL